MKIVGVGLQKTGTTTLGQCLRSFGYKHQTFDQRAVGMRVRDAQAELLAWIDRYESFEDIPWCMLYRDIDQRYPGSKFILTRRKSPEIWLQSFINHLGRIDDENQKALRAQFYGVSDLSTDTEAVLAVYQKHLQDVRTYFAGRPEDFLEVCWEEGDDWRPLATFLGRAIPDQPFPHANQAPGFWQRWKEHWRRRNKTPNKRMPLRLMERPDEWRGE